MPTAGGQEPPTQRYAPGERITAGISGVVMLLLVLVMFDIATDGRLLAALGGSPVDEAERIAREAVET